ncbi:MAG: type II toxin-antitoxin system PemK/MazF family toxin [Chloroflexi bacterium]|nr:type II toxin-antitoxin system PemK/MazF family toxin [Chloroflexota bacterium]
MIEDIQRGDIWTIRFDPSEGDEIQKMKVACKIR